MNSHEPNTQLPDYHTSTAISYHLCSRKKNVFWPYKLLCKIYSFKMMLFHFKYKHFVPKFKKPESGEMAQSINFCCASVRTWVLGLSTRVKRPGVAGCTVTPVSVTPAQGWSKRTVAAHWPSSQSSDSLQVQWETLALKKNKKRGTFTEEHLASTHLPVHAQTHTYISHTQMYTHTHHTQMYTSILHKYFKTNFPLLKFLFISTC